MTYSSAPPNSIYRAKKIGAVTHIFCGAIWLYSFDQLYRETTIPNASAAYVIGKLRQSTRVCVISHSLFLDVGGVDDGLLLGSSRNPIVITTNRTLATSRCALTPDACVLLLCMLMAILLDQFFSIFFLLKALIF